MNIPKSRNRNFRNKFLLLTQPAYELLGADDVAAARNYIAKYWSRLTRYNPIDKESLVGLPKPYLVPANEPGHEFDFDELYYWDSYFMVQGLLDGSHKELVMGILEDLFFNHWINYSLRIA